LALENVGSENAGLNIDCRNEEISQDIFISKLIAVEQASAGYEIGSSNWHWSIGRAAN